MFAKPVSADIVQNFRITVDGYYSLSNSSIPGLPPIGTTGYGTFTIDESQIQFNDRRTDYHQYPPLGYYTLKPSSFSLDFFNRRYTQITDGPAPSQFTRFSFDPTSNGGYRLTSFFLQTSDATSRVDVNSFGEFNYLDTTAPFGEGSASGSVQLTSAEVIPEPSEVLGIPVAIAFGWLYHRRRKARKVTREATL